MAHPPDFAGGSVACFVGPMFAGKSAAMLAAITQMRLAGRSAVIVVRAGAERPALGDAPAGAGVARLGSHDPLRAAVGDAPATPMLAAVRVVAAERLGDVELGVDESAVGVDEGQFFADLAPVASRWAAEGRAVVVAALDGDFRRAPFAPVAALLPLCDAARVTKVAGVCGDCRAAPSSFTRLVEGAAGRPLPAAGDSAAIGAGAEYVAVCRACYEARGAAPSIPRN